MRPLIHSSLCIPVNTVVLSVMSALAPPKYEMIVMSQDAFGRTNEIRGQCNFEQSYPYIGCVCLVNFAALLFTIAQAVKARNLSMEFAESAQIFRALMAITVVLFVGGPVLLLSRDNANTLLFVASSIIFVANACIMLLLFVPKIKFWMTSKKNKGNRRLHISGLEMSRPTSQNSGPTDSYVEDDDDDKTKEFTGMKILTTKTPEELVGEVEALKRLLRKARPRTEETASSEIDALNWFELPRNPSLKSILKKSSELTLGQSDQMPIEVSGHTDKSEGTTGMINSECSEQGSPQWNMSDEIRDEDSSTITSRCRLESLRDKRDMAKMKFVSLVSRDAKDKADTDPSEEGSTGYSMQHVEDEHLS